MIFTQNEQTQPREKSTNKQITFKNARRSTNTSQAGNNVERVKSRYKNNNTTINQHQQQNSSVNRTFNVSIKNGKIPSKKMVSTNNKIKQAHPQYQGQFSMYMASVNAGAQGLNNPQTVPNKSLANPQMNMLDFSNQMIVDLNNFNTAVASNNSRSQKKKIQFTNQSNNSIELIKNNYVEQIANTNVGMNPTQNPNLQMQQNSN